MCACSACVLAVHTQVLGGMCATAHGERLEPTVGLFLSVSADVLIGAGTQVHRFVHQVRLLAEPSQAWVISL